ncbi:MAG TPA: hypothetical protein VF280_10305 [Burkholderiales bacterium]|jgi:hypothetical protein
MFLFMLGGSLVLGFSLFAAASYSEGTLIAARTAAEVIGWLLMLAALAGAVALRQPNIGKVTAAGVSLCCGLLLVYIAHFQWTEVAHAAAAATLPLRSELKMIEAPSPALAAAMGMKEIPAALPPTVAFEKPMPFEKPLLAAAIATIAPKPKDACRDEVGLAWFLCQERARLEYCQTRAYDETCPSPIPASYPG